MNLAIIKPIEHQTDTVVALSADADGVTIYHLTKPVHGKPVTVTIKVSAEDHASNDASAIVAYVVTEAAKAFKQAREMK